jgi:hypothetical protein
MAESTPASASQPKGATGVVVFADGRTIWGRGFGAEGEAVGAGAEAAVAGTGPASGWSGCCDSRA